MHAKMLLSRGLCPGGAGEGAGVGDVGWGAVGAVIGG